MKKILKICPNGHTFYKSSDCPSCPICMANEKPQTGFLSLLSSPARSALIEANIETLEQLSQFTEKEILKLHGIGKASIPTLTKALSDVGLSFKNKT